ncbi:MAG: hypothetical protein U1F98_15645 [Verrucomicrobiota bacterium]
MNHKLLEQLLEDRALGVLPPEVEALLAAYLRDHPEHAALEVEMNDTLALARGVLPPVDPIPAPPPGFTAEHARPAPDRYRWSWLPLPLAAVIALGFGLWILRPSGTRTQSAALAPPPAAAQPAGFWSVSRLADAASKPAHSGAAPVSWISPVRKPRLNSNS